jgi:hypothetical protein
MRGGEHADVRTSRSPEAMLRLAICGNGGLSRRGTLSSYRGTLRLPWYGCSCSRSMRYVGGDQALECCWHDTPRTVTHRRRTACRPSCPRSLCLERHGQGRAAPRQRQAAVRPHPGARVIVHLVPVRLDSREACLVCAPGNSRDRCCDAPGVRPTRFLRCNLWRRRSPSTPLQTWQKRRQRARRAPRRQRAAVVAARAVGGRLSKRRSWRRVATRVGRL